MTVTYSELCIERCSIHSPFRNARFHSLLILSSFPLVDPFGSLAFRFSASRVWNSLPASIRESHSLSTFRRRHFTFSHYSTSAAHLA